ncbi:HNH endonuclease [Noviherbaspirillum sp. 17J57-3]|uniref:HNH endonuclease n=2 Tax=Noviherbaspirillum galbum TaxID=2709383 RepID=A0A6B3SRS6_9BURK|nr:HNH endonuclease [Noviherbaspirillum galbum]
MPKALDTVRTLKDKQRANGRTLALNGTAWRKLRALVLAEQPLCADCERCGWTTPANEVDHADNDPTNNERSNLIGLCRPCHSRKTQHFEHYKRTGQWLPIKGCDVHGRPLDPLHFWNTDRRAQKSPEQNGPEPAMGTHARDRT